MEILGFIIIALLAYLWGSFPTAYVLAGDRVLEKGTRNIGAMNTFRALKEEMGSKRAALAGIVVIIGDAGKAALVVFIAKLFLEYSPLLGLMLAAFLAVLGHCFSVYMKVIKGHFFGGRGLACLLGIILVLNWIFALIFLGIILFVILMTEWLSKKKLIWREVVHVIGHQMTGRVVGLFLCLFLLLYLSPELFLVMLPAVLLALFRHGNRFFKYLKEER